MKVLGMWSPFLSSFPHFYPQTTSLIHIIDIYYTTILICRAAIMKKIVYVSRVRIYGAIMEGCQLTVMSVLTNLAMIKLVVPIDLYRDTM